MRFAVGSSPTHCADRSGYQQTTLLTSTYLHVPGISEQLERELWSQGALTWDEYLAPGASWNLAVDATRVIKNSLKKLEQRDPKYFARKIATREHWRTFPEFSDRIVYLDIETDGGFGAESITMIGAYDGDQFRAFVKGKDIDEFPYFMVDKGLMITFFGSGFDIPLLKKLFPYVEFDLLHIDLCHSMRRLGFRGGLKKIERELGMVRGDDTDGLTGRDAITLWRHYKRGDQKALDLLVEYNREDVVNLKGILMFAYRNLRQELFGQFDK